MLCASGSVVAQCADEPPIAGLPSADDAFADATTMCSDHFMPECDACNPQPPPGSVAAQALQVQCPDPLAGMRVPCAQTIGCQSALGPGRRCAMPRLQQTDPLASLPSAGARATAMAWASTTMTRKVMAPLPHSHRHFRPPPMQIQMPCHSDPTAAACADYVQADEKSSAEIGVLCEAMPYMVGCTLWAQCQVGSPLSMARFFF